MGLDMYLYQCLYVSTFDHNDPDKVPCSSSITLSGRLGELIDASEVCEIRTKICYWRKVNCVHQWFVDNVQNGVDDCGHYNVTVEQLRELASVVANVLAAYDEDPDKGVDVAEQELPTTSGFFFGSTDYDRWYWLDLMDTRVQLDKALKLAEHDPDDFWAAPDFVYHSSW